MHSDDHEDPEGLPLRLGLFDVEEEEEEEEEEEGLPSRPGLFDFAEEVEARAEEEEEDELDLTVLVASPPKPNRHLSTRSVMLFGDGKVLVPGKDQMLAVDGTVT